MDPQLPLPAEVRSPPAGDSVPLRQPPAVPDYELLRCIGHGSYGDVWLARNVLGQFRAVKMIYRSRFSDPRPFEREFEGIQRFEPISRSHPSQLHILHVGKNDAEGCFYYVMELADTADGEKEKGGKGAGENRPLSPSPPFSPATHTLAPINPETYSPKTLRSLLSPAPSPTFSPACPGRLPIPDCVAIGLSLTTALAHLHEQGLVHRDIKPSNVIFVNGVAKLGDIGLVTDAGDTQSIVGTEGYLPPEGPGTPQADIYSLGKVLYEISTGMDRRRFAELPEDLPSWPERKEVIEFNEIVLEACVKNVEHRYASAGQMRKDLELLQRGKSVKQRRLSQIRRRAVRRFSVVVAVVILAAVGIAALLRQLEWFGPPAVTLSNDDGTSGTRSLKATEAYRIGLPALRRGTTEGFRQALESFTGATDADSSFVVAQARLFETYLMGEDHGISFIDRKTERLNAQAARLVKLAPTNAETRAAVAIVRFINEWKWAAAEVEFRQALKADPRCRMALTYYGYFLTRLGRVGEAREVLNRARQLNPESPLIMKFLGHCEFFTRDYDKALQLYLKASDLEPSYPSGHYWAGRAYLALTNYSQALQELKQFELKQGYARSWKSVREALENGGPRSVWTKLIEMEADDVGDNEARPPYFYAECYARLDDTDRALEWLGKAYAQHQSGEHLLIDEFWDRFRQQRRFKEILKNVGLEPWAR